MANKMLVDLERCVGCWTCSMACKMQHQLDDDDFRIVVRTHGSGAGIDRPQGVYPNLRMSWQPIWNTSCTWCAERLVEGEGPFCVACCPTKALAFGDDANPESAFNVELARCKDRHYQIFELPAYEGSRKGIVSASKQ